MISGSIGEALPGLVVGLLRQRTLLAKPQFTADELAYHLFGPQFAAARNICKERNALNGAWLVAVPFTTVPFTQKEGGYIIERTDPGLSCVGLQTTESGWPAMPYSAPLLRPDPSSSVGVWLRAQAVIGAQNERAADLCLDLLNVATTLLQLAKWYPPLFETLMTLVNDTLGHGANRATPLRRMAEVKASNEREGFARARDLNNGALRNKLHAHGPEVAAYLAQAMSLTGTAQQRQARRNQAHGAAYFALLDGQIGPFTPHIQEAYTVDHITNTFVASAPRP